MIRKLSDREHLKIRPAMYIGSVNLTKQFEYILQDGKIEHLEVSYVPGLIKIINEIIDNSVDVAIKTAFIQANVIDVRLTDSTCTVKDNGSGIPVLKNADGDYLPKICWGEARSGSNFDDDANRTQIGMNGVGSFATNVFSSSFVGKSDDGESTYTVKFKNNAEFLSETVKPSSGKSGVEVKFTPDLSMFSLETIDEVHHLIIKQRLINLSLSFPEITFKFNGRKINVQSFKKYVQMFGEDSVVYETEDYKFALLPNESDDFKQFTYVNGLKIPDGGTHVDLLVNGLVQRLREKLNRKFKGIKPGDVKNKLMLVAFLKNFKNTKFNSQSKEKITNSNKEMLDYFNSPGEIPMDTLALKMFKNKAMMDPITEVYRIKEELKRRKELNALNKPKKRIKSDKYYPSIGTKKYLVLAEGESALGSLIPTLGRKECGYYCLKGVPLNAYSSSQDKFTKNKELSELYTIIQNEQYENIIIGADADCDGNHIIGLLFGFFKRYFPELTNGRIGKLQTPVIQITKKDKITRWMYSLTEKVPLKPGEESHYMKGLGSWDSDDLKEIVKIDGLEKMIQMMDFTEADEILEDWLGDDSEPRKKHILANDFSIASV